MDINKSKYYYRSIIWEVTLLLIFKRFKIYDKFAIVLTKIVLNIKTF